jgi:hypothetical protein
MSWGYSISQVYERPNENWTGVAGGTLDGYVSPPNSGTGGGGGPGGGGNGSGLQMLLDGAGQVWAKNSIGNGGWTQETPAGETAISAG